MLAHFVVGVAVAAVLRLLVLVLRGDDVHLPNELLRIGQLFFSLGLVAKPVFFTQLIKVDLSRGCTAEVA